MATYPLIPYLIGVMADSVIYAWLFNNCGGSALILTILHAVSNTVGPNAGIEQAAVVVLIAAILVAVSGPAHFSRRRSRLVRDEGADILNR